MQKIAETGPLGFPEFMAGALYDPETGYYARPLPQVGRAGDFFTSVSVGPLFGFLLADHVLDWWRESGRPSPWRILEAGAHDGRLAGDLLDRIQATAPEAWESLEYAIVEPLPSLAAAQVVQLARHRDRLRQVDVAEALDPLPGYFLANELLDALPFHLIESDGEGWRELGVDADGRGGFRWTDLGPAGEWAGRVPPRPPGYRTEVRAELRPFIAPLAAAVTPGRMLWLDYGFERRELYDVARREGTLRTYRSHQAGDDPLEAPGSQDITAHVDFTALREALEGLGARILRFENQSRFLTGVARPWLLSLEGRSDPGTAKLLRQFQTLTHPAQLGGRFLVMEASL